MSRSRCCCCCNNRCCGCGCGGYGGYGYGGYGGYGCGGYGGAGCGGYGGAGCGGNSCCNFSCLIVLILILLFFSRGRKGICGCNDGGEGRCGGLDGGIIFIITLFYLSCCSPCGGRGLLGRGCGCC